MREASRPISATTLEPWDVLRCVNVPFGCDRIELSYRSCGAQQPFSMTSDTHDFLTS